MNTGMLWFDNDPKTTLETKIGLAVSYYKNKYGRIPNLCLVHPSMLPKPEEGKETLADDSHAMVVHDDIKVRPFRPVLPGHLWIGIEDKNA